MKLPKKEGEPHFGAFGAAMLKKMGWSEGSGVGKNLQGMAEAITVKKKDDTAGIGGDPSFNYGEKWWESVYDSSAKLDALAGLESDSGADSSDSDSDDSDGDAAPKGKEAAKTKNSKKKGKRKKQASDSSGSDSSDSESDGEVEAGRDGIRCTATKAELAIAKELAKGGSWGRWGGRNAKFQRIREAEEAAAAAAAAAGGEASTGQPAAPKVKRQKTQKALSVAVAALPTEGNEGQGLGTAAPVTDSERAIEPMKGFVCHAAANAAKLKSPSGTLLGHTLAKQAAGASTSDAWWSKVFVSAGVMGDISKEREQDEKDKAKRKQGFTEDDQESLYNRTQDGKVTGRKGLGKQAAGRLGNDYKGSKMKYEADSDGEGDKPSTSASASASTSASALLDGIKWKKIIKKALEAAPNGRLKVKKLQKEVLTQVQAKLGGDADTAALKAAFDTKVGSSMFTLADGVVSLAGLASATGSGGGAAKGEKKSAGSDSGEHEKRSKKKAKVREN